MNPFIHASLTRLKEERHDFLQRIDFKIKENKQQFVFHSSETRFTSTSIASLASFLDNVLVISVGMVDHFKASQEFFKFCLVQTRKGTEHSWIIFEPLIGEHRRDLQPRTFDFSRTLCSLLYH